MNPEAMKLVGQALLDYHNGDIEATIILERDDDTKADQPIKMWFRDAQEFPLEKIALNLCYGRVLDIGAGSGLHSLFLQDKGLEVTAIDLSQDAVQVMRKRGVVNARIADIMSFEDKPFDTILMMAHNIGIAGTIDALNQLLHRISILLNDEGQVLLTSVDIRHTDDLQYIKYQEQNLESDRYFGEVRMKVLYKGMEGPLFQWLNIDQKTLSDHALAEGLKCEIVGQHEDGGYLARITHR